MNHITVSKIQVSQRFGYPGTSFTFHDAVGKPYTIHLNTELTPTQREGLSEFFAAYHTAIFFPPQAETTITLDEDEYDR